MFFEKHINRRSKQAMIEFLSGHFRYYTANSWNQGTSYANRIKIPDLGLTREQADKAYELLDTDYWDELRFVIDDFTSDKDGNYTICTNGRSGGYLVLYRGEYYDPGYKSRCRACGQLNYQAVSGEVGRCGRCGKDERINLSRPLRWHHVSAKGMDEDRDFSDWSMSDLRDRVEIVCRFDRACDEIRSAFIEIIDNCKVVEETVMVPKAVKRIVCAEEKQ